MYASLQEAIEAINPKEEKAFYEKAIYLYWLTPSDNGTYMVGTDEYKESFGEVCKNPYSKEYKKETK